MNEVVEIIYQWHQRGRLKDTSRSLGVDQDTVSKYVGLSQQAGVQRDQPFPKESELVRHLQAFQGSLDPRELPA